MHIQAKFNSLFIWNFYNDKNNFDQILKNNS